MVCMPLVQITASMEADMPPPGTASHETSKLSKLMTDGYTSTTFVPGSMGISVVQQLCENDKGTQVSRVALIWLYFMSSKENCFGCLINYQNQHQAHPCTFPSYTLTTGEPEHSG